MDRERHSGFYQLQDYALTIIGLGGIGSWLAAITAKMGYAHITLCDFDVVEPGNIATQNYEVSDVGLLKSIATHVRASENTTDTVIQGWPSKFQRGMTGYITISAVDSIAARKEIWDSLDKEACGLYIDTRMGGRKQSAYVVDLLADYDWYEKTLAGQDDSTAEDLPCTQRASIYAGTGIAAWAAGAAADWVMGAEQPRIWQFDPPNTMTYMDAP